MIASSKLATMHDDVVPCFHQQLSHSYLCLLPLLLLAHGHAWQLTCL